MWERENKKYDQQHFGELEYSFIQNHGFINRLIYVKFEIIYLTANESEQSTYSDKLV